MGDIAAFRKPSRTAHAFNRIAGAIDPLQVRMIHPTFVRAKLRIRTLTACHPPVECPCMACSRNALSRLSIIPQDFRGSWRAGP